MLCPRKQRVGFVSLDLVNWFMKKHENNEYVLLKVTESFIKKAWL